MRIAILVLTTLALAACAPFGPAGGASTPAAQGGGMMGGMGMGMGMMGGMGARHHAAIPAEYAGRASPVPAGEESLARGQEIYTTYCATCHGDGGMGDGPAGAALDPRPAPVAHTSQMLGDDYLLWRISEGGLPFNSAMPAWKETLDEQGRWDVINYIRALGQGTVAPAAGQGGAAFDPQADLFQQVHDLLLAAGLMD